MDKSKIDAMFDAKVLAKLKKAEELGTKTTWTNADQLDLAAEAICECVKDEVELVDVRAVVQATYNHSAVAQKLEEKYGHTGHFVRKAQGPKESLGEIMARLEKTATKA